ncbi:MAG: magnesium chelatase ATPase subunit I, partial [Pyrinomonadaceae bacterium]
MKLALILNAIDPLIGGVLLMGHRGTGKSTAVRALADLLGEIWTVGGCSYHCDPTLETDLCSDCKHRLESGEKLTRQRMSIPLVDLPLGATEDRLCGTIDIERALKAGVKSFEPGLLARANRGFLYVDEVNLLEDHLTDLLLDVAITGRNKVEREGISIEHPARFVLIGSGNPEEGELRPQLIDRFGLHVEVKTEDDLDARVEIVERREDFENNPAAFCSRVNRDQERIRDGISRAQKGARKLKVNRTLLRQIAQLCTHLKIDGHRGELTIARSARALAAFEGRRRITEEDVRRVAAMSLRHRLRRDPLEETAGAEQIKQALAKVFPEQQNIRSMVSDGSGGNDGFDSGGINHHRERREVSRARGQSAISTDDQGTDSPAKLSQTADLDVAMPKLNDRREKVTQGVSKSGSQRGRNGIRRSPINYQRGRYSRAVSVKKNSARVAIDATLRALA